MNLCLYLAARSVSVCFHDRMLALILRLDFPVSGGLVEDDHHARTLEDSVFRYLVAVSVHVTFVDRRRHTFYPCAPFHVCHVWQCALLAGPKSARNSMRWSRLSLDSYHLCETHFISLQLFVATKSAISPFLGGYESPTACNTLQHTATHSNTLQHTATHCNTPHHTVSMCTTRTCGSPTQPATHCNTLRHTATHYSTLQQTATSCNTL